MKELFVKTRCPDTAKILIAEGLTLVSESDGVWTFINNNKQTFSDCEKNKIVFTNVLHT